MPSLNGNWVDLIILLILAYYATEAFRYGFLALVSDFLAFLLSLLLSLRFYTFAAGILKSNFNLPQSFDNALGFIITSIILEIILSYIFARIIEKLPKKIRESKFNKFLGLIPAIGEGIILISFLLTSILALPIKPEVKKAVTESKLGAPIVKESVVLENGIGKIFGGALNDALTYFTIEPDSKGSVQLKNGIDRLSFDHDSEIKMFQMVNSERVKAGVAALTWSPKIVGVGEAYAMDMWQRHYFSHYSPEGKTVVDRLEAAGVQFSFAGENLALAPTVETAMTGLMNSQGHRENILEKRFHKVGIGVVDNGIYGKIFVQEFTD